MDETCNNGANETAPELRDGYCVVSISDDQMEATLELHTPVAGGKPLTMEMVIAALTENKVTYGILQDQIAGAHAKLHVEAGPINIVAARGTPVQEGKDARLVLSHKESVGLEMANGRIDYNEHDYPWNVHKGETIGFLLPNKPHSDGMSVTGQVIKGVAPHEIKLDLSGITLDSRGKLIADTDGVLVVNGSRLSVADLLMISGDLDNKLGNVHSITGVHVKGHVEPGLILESQSDVIVDQNVEDATIKAGGSITIKGGIRGKHSQIFTPGTLTVSFIENAAIFVNGDINVTKSIINSTVACNGTIFAGSARAKHAAVMGGELSAARLIEAVELGTPTFARTVVRLGATQEQRRQLAELQKEIETKEKELSDLDKLETHYRNNTAGIGDEMLQRITLTRTALQQQLGEKLEALKALKEQCQAGEKSTVVIQKRVFPGVVIMINDTAYEVINEYGKGRFTLDDGKVVFHPG